jgi:hypothetical protein
MSLLFDSVRKCAFFTLLVLRGTMKKIIEFILLGKVIFSSATLFLLAIFIVIGSESASAQVMEEWVARFDRGGSNYRTVAIAVDSAGNVYVTGGGIPGGSEYRTVKYDPIGKELWVKIFVAPEYILPSQSRAVASALAVDASGNVYVTGTVSHSFYPDYPEGWEADYYATIKYDSNGNKLWVAIYDGPGSDSALAIAMDSSGNVYVTGSSDGDYATIKYDPNGNELWVARYNGPGNGDDSAVAVTVDAAGNVYVTGSSMGLGTGDDFATAKYDSEGKELWVARYNGPGNGDDSAVAIAVDGTGDVYVTGSSLGLDTSTDYATVKYDSEGKELWVARYNGPDNNYDTPSGLAVDIEDNVYVTGQSGGDYITAKYDSNGNQLWTVQYNGPGDGVDYALAIAVNHMGMVYVTGLSEGSGSYSDYATIKYDFQGKELWVARYNGPGNGDDHALAIAVDAAGNVYVTGSSKGLNTGMGYATVKLTSDSNTGNGEDGNSNGGGSGGVCFIGTISP